jgi:hypothetical protein
MAEIHPFTGARYERTPDGLIRVSLDGEEGLFQWDGQWVRGEIRHADCHLCLWVAGAYGGKRGEGQYRGAMVAPGPIMQPKS